MIAVQRFLSCLSLVSLLFGALACASSGSSGAAAGEQAAILVTLRDFRSGTRFELADEAHTKRVEYYSGARADASRKVQSDEIMSAFVQELDKQGLGAHAQNGRAPAAEGSDVIAWCIEVEQGSSTRHWLVGKGSAAAELQQFQKCRGMFLDLYNITVSFQTVKNDSGKQFFKEVPRPGSDGKHGADGKPR